MNKKLSTFATKAELKAEQDKIVKLQVFDSNCFRNKSLFEGEACKINFLREWLIAIIFQLGNQMDCFMKVLKLLLYVIIAWLQR